MAHPRFDTPPTLADSARRSRSADFTLRHGFGNPPLPAKQSRFNRPAQRRRGRDRRFRRRRRGPARHADREKIRGRGHPGCRHWRHACRPSIEDNLPNLSQDGARSGECRTRQRIRTSAVPAPSIRPRDCRSVLPMRFSTAPGRARPQVLRSVRRDLVICISPPSTGRPILQVIHRVRNSAGSDDGRTHEAPRRPAGSCSSVRGYQIRHRVSPADNVFRRRDATPSPSADAFGRTGPPTSVTSRARGSRAE